MRAPNQTIESSASPIATVRAHKTKRIQLTAAAVIACQSACTEVPSTVPAWQPSVIDVTQTVIGHPDKVSTKLEMASNGDARVTYAQTDGESPQAGTILVISGRWMLVKGLKSEKGREIDFLDIAGLNSQLLLTLLSKSLPNGPPAAGEFHEISFTEKVEPIQVGTSSASGVYPAPWSVTGNAMAPSDSTVTYSIDFKVERGDFPTLHLEGAVSTPAGAIELADSMSLAGWAVHKIGPYEERTSQGTILDYGAKAAAVTAKTLGELRATDSP